MPEKKTMERARRAKRQGKAPTTQAGEFVREEIEHVKRGKHGVKNRKQAVAIGLSKARKAGVDIPDKSKKKGSAKSSSSGSAGGGRSRSSSGRSRSRSRQSPSSSRRSSRSRGD